MHPILRLFKNNVTGLNKLNRCQIKVVYCIAKYFLCTRNKPTIALPSYVPNICQRFRPKLLEDSGGGIQNQYAIAFPLLLVMGDKITSYPQKEEN